MGKIVFITGGARSGKSSFAMKEASKIHGKRLYIATAEPLDDEMRERIERHKKERPGGWDTVEEPMNIAEVMRKAPKEYDVIVLDCLTLWMSNILIRIGEGERGLKGRIHLRGFTGESVRIPQYHEMDRLIDMLKDFKRSFATTLFIVSNEVGMGIVPENKLARTFRDLAGMLNQRVGEIADEVYLVLSGIPVKIKG